MIMLDVTVKAASGTIGIEPDEKAVMALLTPPALSYITELGQLIERDPLFLTFHDGSVGLKIQSLLSRQGIYWGEEVFERQFLNLVTEAIARSKSPINLEGVFVPMVDPGARL